MKRHQTTIDRANSQGKARILLTVGWVRYRKVRTVTQKQLITAMRKICRFGAISGVQSLPQRPLRRAVVVVELILMLPVLLVFLAALIEFGLILANTKVVALASRTGARIAAETSTPGLPSSISTIRNGVDSVLATAQMSSCRVILEHNVPLGGASPLIDGPCNCSAPSSPALPVANGGALRAVRVTVCVELSELTPNLLAAFGFSTATRTVTESTLYPYEN